MKKKNRKSGGGIHSQNWEDYEEDSELSRSLIAQLESLKNDYELAF